MDKVVINTPSKPEKLTAEDVFTQDTLDLLNELPTFDD